MSDFEDYTNLGQVLERNIITMYDYLYRYREPNSPGSLPIRGGAIAPVCPPEKVEYREAYEDTPRLKARQPKTPE